MPEFSRKPAEQKPGAGVIPVAVHQGEICFQFHTTFSGRTAGHLIDFGGGVGANENDQEATVRKFVEETETMYFCDDPPGVSRSVESIGNQLTVVNALFDNTLTTHLDWWCRRAA